MEKLTIAIGLALCYIIDRETNKLTIGENKMITKTFEVRSHKPGYPPIRVNTINSIKAAEEAHDLSELPYPVMVCEVSGLYGQYLKLVIGSFNK